MWSCSGQPFQSLLGTDRYQLAIDHARLLRAAHPEFSVCLSGGALGARRGRAADQPHRSRPPGRQVRHAGSRLHASRPLSAGWSSTKARACPVKRSSTTRCPSSPACGSGWTSGGRYPIPNAWHVTPETARLLQHWRSHHFSRLPALLLPGRSDGDADLADRGRAESAVVTVGRSSTTLRAPTSRRIPVWRGWRSSWPPAPGKTTVMAMLVAWQTLNAVRRPNSRNFTRGFLVVTPGITIKRPPARAPTQRPGQLLQGPRACPLRHAARPEQSQDRDHQLSRLQAAGDARDFKGRARSCCRGAPELRCRRRKPKARCSSG